MAGVDNGAAGARARSPLQRVLVSVASFRRPAELGRLLESLEQARKGVGADIDLLVVDNDAAGSAEEVVRRAPTQVTYVLEPTPGIAAARNRALDEFPRYDAIVFVDDDEWVDRDWLEELLGYAGRGTADVVTGPVLSELPPESPAWIRRAGFFQRPTLAHGTRLKAAATNNTLLRRDAWDRAGRPRFDESFSFTGGSDAMLFHTLLKAGAVIEYCASARVTEEVPPARISGRWLARRALRNGVVSARLWSLDHHPAVVLVRGLVMMVQGVAHMPRVASRGLRGWGVPYNEVLTGVGVVAAVFGLRIQEYARPA
jgi:glycosyltransferase involved in cell wall biosynthesis